jgi:hypothetical protein
MTALAKKIVAANTTNLTLIKDGATGVLKSLDALNTTAAAVFVKFFWYIPTAAAPVPAIGTTVPDLTIEVPALGTTTGNVNRDWASGLQKAGLLFMAITNLAADSDNTAVAAGSALVTVGYE